MISPSSIAVAAAAGNLIGKESELFRFTVKHSFIMLLFICAIVLAQAYLFSWVIPEYQMIVAGAAPAIQDFSKAYTYLLVLALLLIALSVSIIFMNKRKQLKEKMPSENVNKIKEAVSKKL
jgi:lactate permease